MDATLVGPDGADGRLELVRADEVPARVTSGPVTPFGVGEMTWMRAG
jgi:hypothetical protein